MATPSEMVTLLTTALAANPAGVVEVKFSDGRSMRYDRQQALAELAMWERKVSAQASGGLTMKRMHLMGDA